MPDNQCCKKDALLQSVPVIPPHFFLNHPISHSDVEPRSYALLYDSSNMLCWKCHSCKPLQCKISARSNKSQQHAAAPMLFCCLTQYNNCQFENTTGSYPVSPAALLCITYFFFISFKHSKVKRFVQSPLEQTEIKASSSYIWELWRWQSYYIIWLQRSLLLSRGIHDSGGEITFVRVGLLMLSSFSDKWLRILERALVQVPSLTAQVLWKVPSSISDIYSVIKCLRQQALLWKTFAWDLGELLSAEQMRLSRMGPMI